MKKYLFVISFVLGIVQVNAQESGNLLAIAAPQPHSSADQESFRLQEVLSLNQTQVVKVKDINRRRRQSLIRVSELFPQEPEKRDDKIHEMETQYDAEFAAVLTQKQFNEYLELNGRGPSAEPYKPKANEGPTFNEKVHTMIQKARQPATDSSQLAVKDSVNNNIAVNSPGQETDSISKQGAEKQNPHLKDANLQISLTVKDLEDDSRRSQAVPGLNDGLLRTKTGSGSSNTNSNAGK